MVSKPVTVSFLVVIAFGTLDVAWCSTNFLLITPQLMQPSLVAYGIIQKIHATRDSFFRKLLAGHKVMACSQHTFGSAIKKIR